MKIRIGFLRRWRLRCASTHGTGGGRAAAPLHLLGRSSLPLRSSLHFPLSLSFFLSSILFSLFLPLPARSADDVVVPNEQLVAGRPAGDPEGDRRAGRRVRGVPRRRDSRTGTRRGARSSSRRVSPTCRRSTASRSRAARGRSSRSTPSASAAPRYRPKSDDIVFGKDVGGGEWFQLFLRDGRTGKVSMFTDGKSRNTEGPFTRDGKWLAYESTKRTGRDNDVYVVDPSDPKTERLVLRVTGGGWFATDWSPDGRTLLVVDYDLGEREPATTSSTSRAERRPCSRRRRRRRCPYGRARFSPDGRTVYLTSDKDDEFHRLVGVDVATRRWDVLTPGVTWDVSGFDLSDDGSRIAYVLERGGRRDAARPRSEDAPASCLSRSSRSGRSVPLQVPLGLEGARVLALVGAVAVGRLLGGRHDGQGSSAGPRARRAVSTRRRSPSRRRSRGRASTGGRSRASSTARPPPSRGRGP